MGKLHGGGGMVKNLFPKKSIKFQITVLFLIIVLILTSLITVILYNQTSKLFIKEANDRAYNIAGYVSNLIDIDEFVEIRTIEDEATPEYVKLREELMRVRELSGAKYLYTMRKTDEGDFMYVVDGSPDEELSHVGEREESALEYEQAWSGEPYTDNNIFHDKKWGAILSIYYPLKNNDGVVVGIIGIDYSVELIRDGLDKFKTICIVVMAIFSGIILISGLLLSNNISRPIKRAVAYSKQLAELNLGIAISPKDQNRSDELGELAQSLYSIKESFQSLIRKISDSSEQLAATSQEISASSQKSSSAIDEVSRTIEEIAKGASDQAQSTEEGASKVIMLGNIIDKDIEQANNISDIIHDVTAIVHEGFTEIEKLTEINEESNTAHKTISDIIIKTNNSAQKINQASNIITSIAEQTNLLALNAAIEAARAGESGKGFAVVADEIRKLAEQSANSSHVIGQIVEELQINSQDAVSTMAKIAQITKEQTESISKSEEKYKLIDDAMKECQQAVTELNVLGKKMVEMKNVILNTMENLSAIAEENSAATQEVTSATIEQVASMKALSEASENLSQLAQDLQCTVSQFKI